MEPDGDEVTAWAGLPIVVEMLKRLGVEKSAEALDVRVRDAGFTAFQMLTTFVLLMVAGGDCLDDNRVLREDKALCALLGYALPSADTLRRYLGQFHDVKLLSERPADSHQAWIAPENGLLQALGRLCTQRGFRVS